MARETRATDLTSWQFSLRTLLIAVAVVAACVALRYQLHWIIWGGVIAFSVFLSFSNISSDYRNRQI